MRHRSLVAIAASLLWGALVGSSPQLKAVEKPSSRVKTAPVNRLPIISELRVSGEADWVAIAPNAVWTAGKHPDLLVRINPQNNRIVAQIRLPGDACAGIAAGDGRVWVPICSRTQRYILAVDALTCRVVGRIPAGPPPEGGIALGNGSVWFTIGDGSVLIQVDEKTLAIRRRIRLLSGSYNPTFDHGHLWITNVQKSLLTDIAANTGVVVAITRVGPNPRFVTSGAGSVWTLNQGDGSLTRVSETSHRVLNTIPLGLRGAGGDISFGDHTVWVTFPGVPLTAIDSASGRPMSQWVGRGGDSLRFGHGSVWLTNYRSGTILRVSPSARMQSR